MNFAILLVALAFTGCTIRIEPLPKKKVKVVHHYHHKKGHAKPTPAPDDGTLRSKRYPVENSEEYKLIGPEPTP